MTNFFINPESFNQYDEDIQEEKLNLLEEHIGKLSEEDFVEFLNKHNNKFLWEDNVRDLTWIFEVNKVDNSYFLEPLSFVS
jgi:hypothetical protein